MARIVARNLNLYAGGRDISGRSNTATLTLTSEAPEVTVFGGRERERVHQGILDYELSMSGFYDGAACALDQTMSELVAASTWFGHYSEGCTASKKGKEMMGVMTNYSVEGTVGGGATYSSTVTGFSGLFDVAVVAACTKNADETFASVDYGAANTGTNWHVFRIFTLTGTTPETTITLYHKPTEGGTASTITAVTAVSSACYMFAASSGSCARFRYAAASVSGTSACVTFMVSSGSLK